MAGDRRDSGAKREYVISHERLMEPIVRFLDIGRPFNIEGEESIRLFLCDNSAMITFSRV